MSSELELGAIGNVFYFVDRLEEAVEWYAARLGREPVQRGGALVAFEIGDTRLTLHEVDELNAAGLRASGVLDRGRRRRRCRRLGRPRRGRPPRTEDGVHRRAALSAPRPVRQPVLRAAVRVVSAAPTSTPAAAVPSAWAPLRIRVFRMLFIAQLVSNVGLWMQTVGAQWFLVEPHSSATVIALVQTASLLPTLFLALLAGGLADLLDRRRLLIVVSTGTAIAAAVTTLLAWTDVLTPQTLLLMTFLLGCGSSLSAPAWQAIQPELVPKEQIPAASALGSVTVNGARAVGPAVGGVVVALAGPAAVFAINTLTFLVIIGALVAWRRPVADVGVDRERLGRSVVTGVHYVRSAPIVRRIMLRSVLFAFPASALWALLPLASSQELHLGATGYGGVLGLLGAGAVGGVALYPALRRRVPPNGVLAASAVAYALGVLASRCSRSGPCCRCSSLPARRGSARSPR